LAGFISIPGIPCNVVLFVPVPLVNEKTGTEEFIGKLLPLKSKETGSASSTIVSFNQKVLSSTSWLNLSESTSIENSLDSTVTLSLSALSR
jgi:PDZ domain-containing secreted protein